MLTVPIPVYYILGPKGLCRVLPDQVVTRDPRYLNLKQAWCSFYWPRRDKRMSESCAVGSRPLDLTSGQIFWPLRHWASKLTNITSKLLFKDVYFNILFSLLCFFTSNFFRQAIFLRLVAENVITDNAISPLFWCI